MEPHAPKGQMTLFDAGCMKWKRFSNEQPRELRIGLDPDIARRVEEHEKQQAAAIAAPPPPPPPRPVAGRESCLLLRLKLPVVPPEPMERDEELLSTEEVAAEALLTVIDNIFSRTSGKA